jgi:uncharacterized repeat protein (TIGR01451 family)
MGWIEAGRRVARGLLAVAILAGVVVAGAQPSSADTGFPPWDPPATFDLALSVVGSRASMPSGQSIVYTLTARNHGPDATDAYVQLDWAGWTESGGGLAVTGSTGATEPCTTYGYCSLGTMTSGATKVVTVTVLLTSPPARLLGSHTFSGAWYLSGAGGPFIVEANTGNNQGTAPVKVTLPFLGVPPVVDLEVQSASRTPGVVSSGGTATYTVMIRNNGTMPSTVSVQLASVSVSLGVSVSFVDWTSVCDFGAGTSSAQTYCSLGPLAPGWTRTVTAVVRFHKALSANGSATLTWRAVKSEPAAPELNTLNNQLSSPAVTVTQVSRP